MRTWLALTGLLGLVACGDSLADNRTDLLDPVPDGADTTSSGGASSSSSGGRGGASSGGSSGSSSGGSSSGSGGTGSNGADKPNCKYTAHATGLQEFHGALDFHTYAPASYDPAVGHRVVVIMHGQDSNGVGELQALWQPIADAEDLVLVAPKGSRPPTSSSYPDGANWATSDLNDLQDLLGEIDDCFDVDPKRHVLWGFSEGAFYGYLLGIAAADRFSGLAMGGANTSFSRQTGYAPADAPWKIPVSHVHGTQDQNPIALTEQDRDDFVAAGHVFTLHQHDGGHSITAEQVLSQWNDLKDSQSP